MLPAYPKVVILGAGFGGLAAAKRLANRNVEVTLVDRRNYHLFQPLLYQVATAGLSPAQIAAPIRAILRRATNVQVLLGRVTGVDTQARTVVLEDRRLSYDTLVIATGARHAYFGHDEWESAAPGLKTMTDAVQIRERMLLAFEEAERRRSSTGVPAQLTFVIVGGGPTGVELAGSLAELGRKAMGPDFPHLRLDDLSVILVEAGPRVLPGFDAELSAKAAAALTRMGVMIKFKSPVSAVHADGVRIGEEWIPSTNVIWAAGNRASPLLNTLSSPQDSFGRIKVRPDLTIPDDPWIFVIGDAAHCVGHDERPLLAVAPVAMQQARYVADLIGRDVAPDQRPRFVYADRGMLATIGRAQAIAQFGSIHTSGLFAWLLWCVVHIFFLIGFRNRFRVMSEWIWYYLTFKPGARLIFERPAPARNIPSTDHARE